jgi:hypothetical protein
MSWTRRLYDIQPDRTWEVRQLFGQFPFKEPVGKLRLYLNPKSILFQ